MNSKAIHGMIGESSAFLRFPDANVAMLSVLPRKNDWTSNMRFGGQKICMRT